MATSATAAIGALLTAWWPVRKAHSTTRSPAWLAAGAVAAWLAVVPASRGAGVAGLADSDVVAAVFVLATVPLLVGGAVVAAIRDGRRRWSACRTATLEWAVLASGIVAVYTGVVAGLGTLVGGSGPTWLLVAATGAIAVALEPVRHGPPAGRPVSSTAPATIRWPSSSASSTSSAPTPATTCCRTSSTSLRDELRLDAVAIDVRIADGWQRAAAMGPADHATAASSR